MKKSPLILSTLAVSLLGLAGCGKSEPTISLYDADSRLVIQSFGDKESISMPTYRSSATGEVPYSELSEFFYANGAMGNVRTNVNKDDAGSYHVTTADGVALLNVDPNKDVLVIENYEHWIGGYLHFNNGVGPDVASSDDSSDGAVHGSTKTKIVGTKDKETYDLKTYHFDALEKEGKCYLPTSLLSNIFYRAAPTDLLYNGMDFYFAPAVTSGALPAVNNSYFATKLRFSATEGVDAVSVTPKENESYRFAYEIKEGEKVRYRIISLTKDGKGTMLDADQPTDAGTLAKIDNVTYSYTWTAHPNFLMVETFASGIDDETKQPMTVSRGKWKIPLRDTFYGAKTRSQAMADFSYDLLRFQFDRYYGLKDVANYSDFDQYVSKLGLKEGLKSLDSATYDDALAQLTMTHIDDGHTHYLMPSIYTGKFTSAGNELAKKYAGKRYNGLMAKRQTYVDMRAKAMKLPEKYDPADPLGLFMEGSTAVIRFDQFLAPGSIVSNLVTEKDIEENTPTAAFKSGNVPLGFDSSFARIKKNTAIKNVVIDLTCNGGGSVMVIPYILAHMTTDPTFIINDIAMNVVKEFHYSVDLNHDGVWGGEGDTYQGKYNFFVLASDFSFSCANFLSTICKTSGAKLIGARPGGGACTVGAFSDGVGSFYNISSPQQCAYLENGTYKHNDAGSPVDHELSSDSWYDLAKLDAFVRAHK